MYLLDKLIMPKVGRCTVKKKKKKKKKISHSKPIMVMQASQHKRGRASGWSN